jgi:hypothetical protein
MNTSPDVACAHAGYDLTVARMREAISGLTAARQLTNHRGCAI